MPRKYKIKNIVGIVKKYSLLFKLQYNGKLDQIKVTVKNFMLGIDCLKSESFMKIFIGNTKKV